MSDRVARLDVAIPQNRFNFLAIVAHLESHGVHLEYPGTVVVKALTDLGDQFDRNRPWLLSMIGSAPVVRFQWWRNDSEDLYCRIRFIRGLCSIEFGLDGMDRGDEVRFLDAFSGLAKTYVDAGVLIGCIVDRQGISSSVLDGLLLA